MLRSPAHGLLSDSVMIVNFRGRRSGKHFATPVRYQRIGDKVRAFSNTETQWWKNLRDAEATTLHVAGEERPYRTHVIENDPEKIRELLVGYLTEYPEDAVYHDVRIDADGQFNPADLDKAAQCAVVVEGSPHATLH